jgi:hypothetical protein
VLTKEHFDYLKPALAKLLQFLQEKFSIMQDEVRRYKGKDGDAPELMATAADSNHRI